MPFHQSSKRFKAGISALFFAGIVMVSCNSGNTSDHSKVADPAFFHFIRKFKVLSLPLKLDYDEINGPNNNFPNLETEDTIFINQLPKLIYGLLPDTSNFYAVIVFGVGDALVPMLVTFDKNGKKINEESLNIELCAGAGPGFGPCYAYSRITKNLSIHCVDSVFITAFDTASIPGTKQLQCDFQDGKINVNGKIELKSRHTGKYLELTTSLLDPPSLLKVMSLNTYKGAPDHTYVADTITNHTPLSENIMSLLKRGVLVFQNSWNQQTENFQFMREGILRQKGEYFSYEIRDQLGVMISNRDSTWFFVDKQN